jgi:hypothetical protein
MSNVLKGTYDYSTVEVRSADDLTELLNTVNALPQATWLELAAADRAALLIGLGREYSSLRFIMGNSGEGVYHSVGTLDSPLDGEFDQGTVPTSMDSGSAVSMSEAMAAVSEFFETGRMPAAIQWKMVEVPEADPEPVDGWDAFSDGEPS